MVHIVTTTNELLVLIYQDTNDLAPEVLLSLLFVPFDDEGGDATTVVLYVGDAVSMRKSPVVGVPEGAAVVPGGKTGARVGVTVGDSVVTKAAPSICNVNWEYPYTLATLSLAPTMEISSAIVPGVLMTKSAVTDNFSIFVTCVNPMVLDSVKHVSAIFNNESVGCNRTSVGTSIALLSAVDIRIKIPL